jgi:hypothetical protein
LGVAGNQRVRDLWRQKDLGVLNRTVEIEVLRHGVAMIRLTPSSQVGTPDR